MTQAQLAEAVDLHEVFISQLERGKRGPGIETIDAVASALGMEPWQLLKIGADAARPQRKRELLAGRVTAVVEMWPEAHHERLLGVIAELGRLSASTRTVAPARTRSSARKKRG